MVQQVKKTSILNSPYKITDLKFSFDISKANYQLDAIQEKLLSSYLRVDPKFRRAFSTDFTSDFLQFLKDKAELKEPIHLSIIGTTRGGKSSIAHTIAIIKMAFAKKYYDIKYVCGNSMEFLEKLKTFKQDDLSDSVFVIDEIKTAMYNIGSVAKKSKFLDVQNIIAINNISTIMISPTEIANDDAFYLLRVFGRCFKTKTVRLMLYNLQDRNKYIPMGMIYLPIYNILLPKPFNEIFDKQYLEKKKSWVMLEQKGKSDVLSEIRRKEALKFTNDNQYKKIKSKDQKIAYISQILGSEWTKSEIEDIFNLTKLIEQGISFDK